MDKYLLAIIILASILRLLWLGKYPVSLYWEEAALGYDAYSILKTGMDYHGNPIPLVAFESFGDYKPSGYFYAAVPAVALLGLSEMAVRLPSALAGILTVAMVYFIIRELGGSKNLARISALMLAIMPWHIHFSRVAFEVNLASMWLILGIWMLLKARKNPKYLILAAISMTGSMYTYHGLRVVAPLITILLSFNYLKIWVKSRYLYISLGLAVILLSPLLMAINSPQVTKRFSETSMFSESLAVADTNKWREADDNQLWSRVMHHRYWYWGREMVSKSLSHLNFKFLFLEGDQNSRHQSGWIALLYNWMIIPLMIGVFELTYKNRAQFRWIIGWILISTIPIALTKTAPHTLRFLPAAAGFAMIMGLGGERICKWTSKLKYKNIGYGLMGLLIGISLVIWAYDYSGRYAKSTSSNWQYGYKQVAEYLKLNQSKYNQVYLTRAYGRPSIYLLFYLTYDPKLIQDSTSIPQDQSELLKFDKYSFLLEDETNADLVISHIPIEDGALLKMINFLDGSPAFYIYET